MRRCCSSVRLAYCSPFFATESRTKWPCLMRIPGEEVGPTVTNVHNVIHNTLKLHFPLVCRANALCTASRNSLCRINDCIMKNGQSSTSLAKPPTEEKILSKRETSTRCLKCQNELIKLITIRVPVQRPYRLERFL